MQFLREWLGYILLIALILLLRIFVIEPVMVDGPSMEPTLYDGDYMFLNKIGYVFGDIQRFDIVVANAEEMRVVKRVIGLPGEHVMYRNNTLYINGEAIKEPFTRRFMDDFSLENLENFDGEVIPDNKYLILGDNRPISQDSRDFGLVSRKDIIGKASFVLLPFKHFGRKE